MSMKYQVVLEYDAAGKSVTATVPGLPIVVEGKNERDALKLVREAIAFYFESETARPPTSVKETPVRAKLVTVEV